MKVIKTILALAIILILTNQGYSQSRSTGLILDDKAYLAIPRKANNLVYKSVLPESVSYESYLPSVESQGSFGTCAAFSTAYYMRTAIEAIQLKLTEKIAIDKLRFAPDFIYQKVKKTGDAKCQAGAKLDLCLETIKTFGVAKLSSIPYPSCNMNVDEFEKEAANYKIKDYVRIYDLPKVYEDVNSKKTSQEKESILVKNLVDLKRALSEGSPVPCGMLLPTSLYSLHEDTWQVSKIDLSDLEEGKVLPHAMLVVGYDDKKGAFRIVNSWGKDWADNGLFWIPYEVFLNFTMYAFQVYPTEKISPAPTETTLKATVDFKLTNGSKMDASRLVTKNLSVTEDASIDEMGAYKMVNAYPSGSRFKFSVNNSKASYIYVIGTDQTKKLNRLFPFDDKVSALVGNDQAMAYPSATKSIELDNTKGQEYIMVLFSENELNMNDLVSKMDGISGSLTKKVTEALGSKLMDWKKVNYNPNQIGFEVKGQVEGTVVPLLITMEHN